MSPTSNYPKAAFDEVFDHAGAFHGFADYLRGYHVLDRTCDPATLMFADSGRAWLGALPVDGGRSQADSGGVSPRRAGAWRLGGTPNMRRYSRLNCEGLA